MFQNRIVNPACIWLLLVMLHMASLAFGADIVYRETFGNGSGQDAPCDTVGWHANLISGEDSHELLGNLHPTVASAFAISAEQGKPNNLSNILGIPEESQMFGYARRRAMSNLHQRSVFWTEEALIDHKKFEVTAIRFHLYAAGAKSESRLTGQVRVMIRIDSMQTPTHTLDDVWLVSKQTFSTIVLDKSATNFATDSSAQMLAFPAEWQFLNFISNLAGGGSAGSCLEEPKAVALRLTAASITGVGFYLPASDLEIGLDTFEIEARRIAGSTR
jgi:hypothetical protein